MITPSPISGGIADLRSIDDVVDGHFELVG